MVRRLGLAVATLIVLGTGCVEVSSSTRATGAPQVSGGGCPPHSTVVFSSSDGSRVGSATADDRGAFDGRVELAAVGDPKRLTISVACGSTVIVLAVTLTDRSDSNALTIAAVVAGGAIVASIVTAVLRSRSSRAATEPTGESSWQEVAR